jgi:hypothetical protein
MKYHLPLCGAETLLEASVILTLDMPVATELLDTVELVAVGLGRIFAQQWTRLTRALCICLQIF